jgi:glycosyltransferase involved in cell wall biosynthesis
MRLLHILSQRPGRSGSGVFLAAMVREAARRGIEQHVIAAGPPGTSAAELGLRDDQMTPIIFPSDAAPFPLPGNSDVMPYETTVFSRMTPLQIEQYLAASRAVMEDVRARFRPEIVHAHHLWLMTALAREVFADVPVLATSHNAELRQMIKAPHLAPHVVPGVRALDAVCVLTPQSVEDTIACFGVEPERIALTGAGFRDDLFHLSDEPRGAIVAELRERSGVELPVREDEQLVTFVGRLSTPKGVPFLLDAVAALRDAPPHRLVLVGATGSGENGRLMHELVASAGDAVLHLGAQPPEAVARILQISGVFALPSLFEGLPLTLLEALACGCPAVVSALPTIASWVPQEWRDAGYVELVPPLATTHADEPIADDVPRFTADLAAALRRRLEHPLSNDARRSIAETLREHTWSSVFDRYEHLYDALRSPKLRHRSAINASADPISTRNMIGSPLSDHRSSFSQP